MSSFSGGLGAFRLTFTTTGPAYPRLPFSLHPDSYPEEEGSSLPGPTGTSLVTPVETGLEGQDGHGSGQVTAVRKPRDRTPGGATGPTHLCGKRGEITQV